MSDAQPGPGEAMLHAMAELWRLPAPGPENLLAAPAFVRLREACRDGYLNAGKEGPTFALSTALRSLGLPCELRADAAHLASPVQAAAIGLDTAFRATHARRLHLAPLDLAEEIPPLAFGPARVARFSAEELRALVDTTRLKRMFQGVDFDADRFSEFHWLVVEEEVALDKEPEARAVPVLFMDMRQDLGQVEPHKGRFPGVNRHRIGTPDRRPKGTPVETAEHAASERAIQLRCSERAACGL